VTAELIVSLHDVAPGSFDQSRRWLDLVEDYGVRATLLVIPGPWRGGEMKPDDAFCRWLIDAEQRGHELALHGWEHTAVSDPTSSTRPFETARASFRARGCAEFSVLGPHAARERIVLGRERMRKCALEPVGFIPPGWLMRNTTVSVLRDLGFGYTATQWSVIDLRSGTRRMVPSTSQRPRSAAAGTAAGLNVQATRWWSRAGRPLRMALHPDDLEHSRLIHATRTMLSIAIANGLVTDTYGSMLRTAAICEGVLA
jgi:predicted deacetylase